MARVFVCVICAIYKSNGNSIYFISASVQIACMLCILFCYMYAYDTEKTKRTHNKIWALCVCVIVNKLLAIYLVNTSHKLCVWNLLCVYTEHSHWTFVSINCRTHFLDLEWQSSQSFCECVCVCVCAVYFCPFVCCLLLCVIPFCSSRSDKKQQIFFLYAFRKILEHTSQRKERTEWYWCVYV